MKLMQQLFQLINLEQFIYGSTQVNPILLTLLVLQDLWNHYEWTSRHRYFVTRTISAGRHDIPILEGLINDYPENAFLALFRMHRASFWLLVELVAPL